MAHLDLVKWREDLKKDKAQLRQLLDQAKPILPPRDAKLAKLKELIGNKVRNPATDKDGHPNRKGSGVYRLCRYRPVSL